MVIRSGRYENSVWDVVRGSMTFWPSGVLVPPSLINHLLYTSYLALLPNSSIKIEKDGAKKEWQEQKVGLGLNKEIFDAEMWGISEAFKVAEQKTRQVRQPWIINIFCDSQTIINNLRSCDSGVGQALKMQIYQKAKKLGQQGHSIFIRWAPGHSGIEENKRADKAAKEAVMRERVRTAKWTSLTHVKRQIKEEKSYRLTSGMSKKLMNERLAGGVFISHALKHRSTPS